MKMQKRVLGFLMSLVLIFTIIPMTAFAADDSLISQLADSIELTVETDSDSYPETNQIFSEVDGDSVINGITTVDSIESKATVAQALNADAVTESNGKFYNQLNARQKNFYDKLKSTSISTIKSAGKGTGSFSDYNMIEFTLAGATDLTLTGIWNGSDIALNANSKALESQLYTDMCVAIEAFRYDEPSALWTTYMFYGYYYNVTNSTTRKVTRLVFGFDLAYEGREEQMYSDMMGNADIIVNAVKAEATDTYSKILLAHDVLAEINEYADTPSDEPSHPQHLAYSGLTLNTDGNGFDPVCDGYSKAMKILCDKLNIPCVLVVSDDHMWNNIKMDDGRWYNLDLTWNDTGNDPYAYFLIGSDTVVNGYAFKSEPQHQELNPYSAPQTLFNYTLKYPTKAKAAYTYIGKDYPAPVFPDVTRNDWFFDYVEEAYELGIFKGNTSGKFNPNASITRAEFAQAMASYAGADLSQYNYSSFSDVNNEWYAKATTWAFENGIMQGSGGKFRPNDPLSRQEMCVVFANLEKGSATPTTGLFGDDTSIASWAKSSVYFCKEIGLVVGDTKGNFNPNGRTTRAEAATVFVNYANSK